MHATHINASEGSLLRELGTTMQVGHGPKQTCTAQTQRAKRPQIHFFNRVCSFVDVGRFGHFRVHAFLLFSAILAFSRRLHFNFFPLFGPFSGGCIFVDFSHFGHIWVAAFLLFPAVLAIFDRRGGAREPSKTECLRGRRAGAPKPQFEEHSEKEIYQSLSRIVGNPCIPDGNADISPSLFAALSCSTKKHHWACFITLRPRYTPPQGGHCQITLLTYFKVKFY